jgi:hypothetical protein
MGRTGTAFITAIDWASDGALDWPPHDRCRSPVEKLKEGGGVCVGAARERGDAVMRGGRGWTAEKGRGCQTKDGSSVYPVAYPSNLQDRPQ